MPGYQGHDEPAGPVLLASMAAIRLAAHFSLPIPPAGNGKHLKGVEVSGVMNRTCATKGLSALARPAMSMASRLQKWMRLHS